MSVTADMVSSLRRPREVMRRHLAQGRREDRVLIYLMASCIMFFVSYLPVLARNAYLSGEDMGPQLGGIILAWLFVAPLALYGLAFIFGLLLRVTPCKANLYSVRLAFFWSLLAATPFLLLRGLTAGFVGDGPQLTLVGALWFVAFVWVFLGSLSAACKGVE